ncbi:error-prone DNA polymerase [Azospirillum brasilense]|uniref:Error-prone DNA polymerase n=2 Tax=Azospirillum brasilense TaxID=192 RepID=A0ABU4PEL2_AZOBR|nr:MULTISPECIES: error-prone DNA polymerase [Azospirillum]ALJ36084.1 DNA polymerase [Azospirillum brasilense]MDW7552509.1 error-prone DNA polymerase [Azospirillum brasilense]MDW7592301.1 error-prone DNA polymerase [Azospirillum brasilense]MDW7627431.1 error-prone DNA polymerase [Azospirillum brasilense]MDX5954880.1 error-prone DNA polymerase [Azospirillum brasilense]
MTPYAELQVSTSFTFLEGASHPDELALTAAGLGHAAVAVTDRNSLAGVVQAHAAARKHGLRLIVGCRLDLTDADSLLAYPTDRAAYARLSRLLTLGKRRAPKGACFIARADLLEHAEGMLFLLVPPDRRDPAFVHALRGWRNDLGDRLHLAASHRYRGDDQRRLSWLGGLAEAERVPLVATNDVLYHTPARRPLADVMTCIRSGTTIDEAGWRLSANAERHLKAGVEMARLFHRHPDAVARTVEIAAACRFSLEELRYEYPDEVAEDGRSPQETLTNLTWAGAVQRYPDSVPETVAQTLHRELALIGQLDYAPYFLTVHDIVRHARSQDILCQGRGSAANSAVCYCLGITSVDPATTTLLFERFISSARNEPPDIDVDFEHERREEVIQYIYRKYGRERAGLTATVIRYRARGAIREVGKAMGLSADLVARLSSSVWGWSRHGVDEERARQYGFDPDDPRLRQTLELAQELIGFPRHLSQHVGGFVITRGPLSDLCPIANAAMKDRTTIEWDKDDIDALGILKVDVLALGMLTCLHRGFDLLKRHYKRPLTLATVPQGDSATYDMLCRADSLGVFQVESRAQMSMLPRLRPKEFYDLVIQVAIVRPGPIQGDMVHPYLRRRSGEEVVTYPSKDLEAVLKRTLGVPLFQEQAMQIAIVGAGFSAEDADRLRRAMATFRKTGEVQLFRDRFIEGMVGKGYDRAFAERCFQQIEGFGEYGFPESHAASFALLAYVSAWMKCHHPDVFAAALLNSQPMGFYAPAQIVRDAREHGVTVLPPDVNASDWDCTLEPLSKTGPHILSPGGRGSPGNIRYALRLGLRLVRGMDEDDARRLVLCRGAGYRDPYDLWRRARMPVAGLERLARADAFRSVGLDRRAALWAVKALGAQPLPLFSGLTDSAQDEPQALLPAMALGEHVVMDYGSLCLSLKAHPMALLRDGFTGVAPTERLGTVRAGTRLTVAGLALVRQRPGSAEGVVFITLEDETGIANLVIMPDVFETFRKTIIGARLIAATGRVERSGKPNDEGGEVIHLRVERLSDLTHRLRDLTDPDALPNRSAAAVFPEGRNFR